MFAKNIKYLREQRGWTQGELATKLGYKAIATVHNWEAGVNKAPYTTLSKIARLFSIDENDLMYVDLKKRDDDQQTGNMPRKSDAVRINVYGRIPAGIPEEATGEVIGWEDIPKEWTTGGREYFALRVSGDSMEPKYLSGDIIICRKQYDCESGQDAVVYVNGYDATLKKVIKKGDCVILQPINTKYDPRVFHQDEQVSIVGVVVELRRTI